LIATIPDISIELDYFTYVTPEMAQKDGARAPYTHMSVIIHNNSANVRITNVKVIVAVIKKAIFGRKKEFVFIRFQPFFVDATHRSERQHVYFDRQHPTQRGYYKYGIEDLLSSKEINMLEKVVSSDTQIPSHYVVKNSEGARIKIEVSYAPGLYGSSRKNRQSYYTFEPVSQDSVLTGWKITNDRQN
jgi:hypothetical protein